tara:strand:+ start:61 stop:438 length:378 start_codon:yes stop_codon:yes gene_type:complete
MKFDKPTARKIRDAMQEALDKADVNGVTIEIGNCSFTEGEATYKVKVLIDGAKSRDEEALEQMAHLMGLDTSKIATLQGMRVSLVSYNTRARKRPWVVQDLTTAQKYIIDDDTAKRLFGAEEKVS